MTEVKIELSRSTHFTGRNGYFRMNAISLLRIPDQGGDNVSISPVTMKGFIANCHIEIPVEDIDVLIHHLEEIKKRAI